MPHPRSHTEPWAPWLPAPDDWDPHAWRQLDAWLYAVDLYNHGYWWEAHEQIERLWRTQPRTSEPARFLQALIKLCAAVLNRALGKQRPARSQAVSAADTLDDLAVSGSRTFMGIEIASLASAIRRWASNETAERPMLRLEHT